MKALILLLTLNQWNADLNYETTYTQDQGDYWQTPTETVSRKRGDCEDVAIRKAMLLGSGVIVLGRLPQGLHMVAQDVEGRLYDNSNRSVRTSLNGFQPIMNFNLMTGKTQELGTIDPRLKLRMLRQFSDLLRRMEPGN